MTTMTADRLDWRDNAACRTADAEMFFGPDGETVAAQALREAGAKTICAGCPVRTACLNFADRTQTRHGVYGGRGEDDRAGALRVRIRRAGRNRRAA